MKYYAIKGENYSNIVESWDLAKEIISTIKKPKYKSFSTLEGAQAFIDDKDMDDGVDEPKCYIDGSYDDKSGNYSFGGVLIINDQLVEFKRKFESDEYSQYRNVAGEIRGASYIINYCVNRGIKKLHIFYDYIGIENWYKGIWKANTSIAIKYVEYANKVRNKIDVIFHKVKSHTNNKYNDLADKLAKNALDII